MSDRPTSFHDFKWACGHTGPGYCHICRDEQVAERDQLRDALEQAQQQIDSLQAKVHLCAGYDYLEEQYRLVVEELDAWISDAKDGDFYAPTDCDFAALKKFKALVSAGESGK